MASGDGPDEEMGRVFRGPPALHVFSSDATITLETPSDWRSAMRVPAHLALLAFVAAGAPAMAQPLEPEQASLLEKAREAAIRYSESLPDFICTEVVRRTQDAQGNGRWRTLDTLTLDRKSTRLNSSHLGISYAVFCLKKKKITPTQQTKPSQLRTHGCTICLEYRV